MELEFYIFTFIEALTGFSAIMIGLLFLTVKSRNQVANVFLVVFMWSLAWLILSNLLMDFIEEDELEFFDFLDFDTMLLIIPALFLYIIITINKSFNLWHLLLFLPGMLFNFLSFEEDSVLDLLFTLLFPIINLPLMIIAFAILNKHKKKVANYYSELEYKTLSWIKSIIITVLVLHFFILSVDLAELFSEVLGIFFSLFEILITLFIVYWVGYNGFFQAQLFSENLFIKKNAEVQFNIMNTEADAEEIDIKLLEKYSEVKSKIEAQELFKNPSLNLRNLASSLEVKEKELSRLINQCSNTNFYQFINRFRVDEFKNLLESPKAKQMSILGLAQEAGFSSKSTFYTAFKSLEGVTPKQYELALNKYE